MQLPATIIESRMLDNDMGTVTQYYPVLDLRYEKDGVSHEALNIPVARETYADRARVKALLSDAYKPGATITIEENSGRVRVA